jgi:tetratricopeptide (TPR) repeat protein
MNPQLLLRTFLVVSMVGTAALGQEKDIDAATSLFKAGKDAFARKEYPTAAQAFEEANRYSPRGEARFNAAIAWELAGQNARAADLFESVRAEFVGQERADVVLRLTRIETKVATLSVQGRGALVRGSGRAPLPATIHLEPGRQKVRVFCESNEATAEEQDYDAKAGSRDQLLFCGKASPGTTPADSVVTKPTGPLDPGVREPPVPSASPSLWPIVGWSIVGAGVVSGGLASGFGFKALGERDTYNGALDRARTAPNQAGYDTARADAEVARDRVKSSQLVTNVFWVASGALVLGGLAIVLFLPNKSSSTNALRLRQSPFEFSF